MLLLKTHSPPEFDIDSDGHRNRLFVGEGEGLDPKASGSSWEHRLTRAREIAVAVLRKDRAVKFSMTSLNEVLTIC